VRQCMLLKPMVVTDECLKRVACSFANFKSLVLVNYSTVRGSPLLGLLQLPPIAG
jgi:hypothetical protein